ncbi:MAG: KpsF/GutQ family sugar-phosphate isomerase [Elusimicrobia bacterium]|nr:KpsF/GutQ family sugar-phosphate isomerase [Elusimicrobiota bacterium]
MIIRRAKKVLHEEARAIKKTASMLGEDFEKAVELISAAKGKVIVMGIGKSGLVGRKIAATLSSTGTPALFLHAAESLHGDIGVIEPRDLVIVLSYSGKTEEISIVLPLIRKRNVPMISITNNRDSQLGRNSDVVIPLNVDKEACPMDLVPTTSTTVMLAVGDALAIALLEKKGFSPDDFASLHPGGALGKKLLVTVRDIIDKTGSNPVIREDSTVKDALIVMTSSRVGAASVVNEKGDLVGYFTDGDLRRGLQNDPYLLSKELKSVMSMKPTTISADSLAINAREILKNNEFDNLPVIDSDGRVIGIIDERDIIREGI